MPTESASLTVLVIDDEPLIRWALSEALAQAGHTVVEAPDGTGGLRAVMTAPCPFDVFLDFRLPDSNDFRLLHAIRTWAPRSAVVLMTASGTPELVVDAYRLGAYKVLDKPFDIAAVQNVVSAAASRAQEVNSMAQLAIRPSPFQCRWISAASEIRFEEWTCASCLRCRDHPRGVSEDECG